MGSATHWAQVPGPLGGQVERDDGPVWCRLKGGSLMAPVEVTWKGLTTSSSDGGGVCVCCCAGIAVAVREVLVRDEVTGVDTVGASAQGQYLPSEQKPQPSSTDMCGSSCG